MPIFYRRWLHDFRRGDVLAGRPRGGRDGGPAPAVLHRRLPDQRAQDQARHWLELSSFTPD